MTIGVSVVVCCHNSSQRLPQTLAHLAAQHVPKGFQWEVIIVDNASTDGTSQAAHRVWPVNAPALLKIVYEPQIGLSHARHRGLLEAKYAIVSFVDDDNWVCPEWIDIAAEIMDQHPDVGACGGFSESVCEVNPPAWFEHYKACYAIGAQGDRPGDITWARGYLWGAGLTVRKSAWQRLIDNKFRSILVDRRGKKLSSGGDSELCLALRLNGWKLWYEPRLQLRHFLPEQRLKWSYLRKMNRGFGAATVGLDPYFFALDFCPQNLKERFRQTWQWQIVSTLLDLSLNLLRCSRKFLPAFCYSFEAVPEVALIELQIGRLFELTRNRKSYGVNIRVIRNAPWKRISRTGQRYALSKIS